MFPTTSYMQLRVHNFKPRITYLCSSLSFRIGQSSWVPHELLRLSLQMFVIPSKQRKGEETRELPKRKRTKNQSNWNSGIT